ncbi:RadC family protein [Natranaerofaba carboxydovora]|uniref:RadC family protein n=1 Tax=Natranaerofaba carboxydovora TaxID=2742683 RepID=UPI001F129622|nr:DNA repair protein RadC [Natranaerofaba carboxydovora]UMZ72867.1 RadC-like JAB domain protein [Natranaerofaba carboxydovora]
MKKVNDKQVLLPQDELPREKLLTYGAEFLTTSELIAILLGTGNKNHSVLEVADLLLNKYSDLSTLAKTSPLELSQIEGIGTAKSVRITAAFELASRIKAHEVLKKKSISSPQDVYDLVISKVQKENRELFILVLLDTKNKIIALETISMGSLNSSIVHPREVFRKAISWSSAAIILVHNHPSGDPGPSKEDKRLTKRLFESGEILGIEILDHVIIGSNEYFSFKENNYI